MYYCYAIPYSYKFFIDFNFAVVTDINRQAIKIQPACIVTLKILSQTQNHNYAEFAKYNCLINLYDNDTMLEILFKR